MKLLIKICVQNSCTPISLFVPPTLPVKGYKNPLSKISVDTLPVCLSVKICDNDHKFRMVSDRAFIFSLIYSLWYDVFFDTKFKVNCQGQMSVTFLKKKLTEALLFDKCRLFFCL